jgi:hypothetical protein
MPKRSSTELDEGWAKFDERRRDVQRRLIEGASKERGYPACGLLLAPDHICTMEAGHRGNHG